MQSDEAETPQRAVFFTHEFKRNLRQLAKKYRRIQKDIEPILADIQTGNLPGDQIPGVTVEIYKARARNSDSARGKSGGYRIIYQKKEEGIVILITIYSKTEQSDISANEIQAILKDYEQETTNNHDENASEFPDDKQTLETQENEKIDEAQD